ncbi:Short chain dehydrogenase reductase family [Pyrenophora tritici-repentis]|nr:Short chain dehydrogenase reductase protein [Pyrenophora tritici-repentis]KAI2479370.1 Short chain dehydrogenase reductase family [Pyrenophora tritici-repentis]
MALFNGRVIGITGAASGIGLATARLLASRGAKLSLADVNGSALEKMEKEIKEKFPDVQILRYVLDVSKENEVKMWIEKTIDVFGQLDGAANLAGVIGKSIGLKGIDEQSLSEWDFVLSVNLTGVMLCLKYQLQHISSNGAIVNASSIGGLQGMAKNAAYTASKHGVIGLTRTAAKEAGHRGVRVNAICPGFIYTPMSDQSWEIQAKAVGASEEKRKARIESVPLGRGGTPEECAELIVFLLGEGSSFVTGSAMSVDGGWNC